MVKSGFISHVHHSSHNRDFQIGAVFSTSFCGQAGYLLACGGAMGSVTVWDMRSLKAATQKWPELKKMGLQPDAVQEEDDDADA